MKNFLFIFFVLTLISCGKNGKNGSDGLDGATSMGLNGVSTGVDFADIEPGLACANGGISIFTFEDGNSDGQLQSDEFVIKVKALCNGLNGTNGIDGVNGTNGVNASITLESVASSTTCPNGGVKISSNTSFPVEICNGVDGLNGEQGLPGIQGIPGIAGSDGTNGQDGANGTNGTLVTPVKFCATDNSTFPEYGLLIGGELFAVYWGTTPASPHKAQAFLTKLVAGNYMSTGGNNCLFSVPAP